jgi:hypothetical protein
MPDAGWVTRLIAPGDRTLVANFLELEAQTGTPMVSASRGQIAQRARKGRMGR